MRVYKFIVEKDKELIKSKFSATNINQAFEKLCSSECNGGTIIKAAHGDPQGNFGGFIRLDELRGMLVREPQIAEREAQQVELTQGGFLLDEPIAGAYRE